LTKLELIMLGQFFVRLCSESQDSSQCIQSQAAMCRLVWTGICSWYWL